MLKTLLDIWSTVLLVGYPAGSCRDDANVSYAAGKGAGCIHEESCQPASSTRSQMSLNSTMTRRPSHSGFTWG